MSDRGTPKGQHPFEIHSLRATNSRPHETQNSTKRKKKRRKKLKHSCVCVCVNVLNSFVTPFAPCFLCVVFVSSSASRSNSCCSVMVSWSACCSPDYDVVRRHIHIHANMCVCDCICGSVCQYCVWSVSVFDHLAKHRQPWNAHMNATTHWNEYMVCYVRNEVKKPRTATTVMSIRFSMHLVIDLVPLPLACVAFP